MLPSWREVHRDRWLLAVDKPSGLPVQPDRRGQDNLYDLLVAREHYVALHHRLDTPASGLVLFSLSRHANVGMARLFSERRARRGYRVVVLGDPGEAGVWEEPIDGQEARTHFERLSGGRRTSVLRCWLETGRTHQIRRHAADAGHPVLGDRRHGGAAGRAWKRLALHAESLGFRHPVTGEEVELVSELPDDLAPLVARAR